MIKRTFRRGVFLLLGGVILLPYALLAVTFGRMLGDPAQPRALVLVLLAVTVAIGCVPAVLRGTRALEIAAVRGLLDVDLPDPPESIDRETRLRTALWYLMHLLVGGLVGLALLVALPMALVFLLQRLGIGGGFNTGFQLGPVAETLAGLALLALVWLAVAGLGSLTALMAPVLLGPSPAQRIARLEAEADELAERNRLARELHDSVGHALTVTTVQAAAAQRVLGTNPEFARQALAAIESTGRAAMEDLDHVLGLLREPSRSLNEVRRLAPEAQITGDVAGVGPVVSREAYRIVQEGLTNAAKHAPGEPVAVRVHVGDKAVEIRIANPSQGGKAVEGRGLTGMRERVRLLGGQITAGPAEGLWRIEVRLPR